MGRELVYKESSKSFRATVAMVTIMPCDRQLFSKFLLSDIPAESRLSVECGNAAKRTGGDCAVQTLFETSRIRHNEIARRFSGEN